MEGNMIESKSYIIIELVTRIGSRHCDGSVGVLEMEWDGENEEW
jgi:hypothetical protein